VKILLVVDGSSYSEMATEALKALQPPSEAEITVMTVVPEHTFLGGVRLGALRGSTEARKKLQEAQQQRALELLQRTLQVLSASKVKAESLVRWGDPAKIILNVADKNRASLVVMGAKGLTSPLPLHLGSVAQTVMKHARASVLLVRKKIATINRVLLATDGSKYSDAVTRFLLDLPLPQQSQLIVITALQSHLAAFMKMPTLDLETNQELLANLQKAEESQAQRITAESEKQFQGKGYKTISLVIQGGAADSILKAAEEYDPEIIALGTKGLTGIESLLLGSVAERVARYAECSVLIGRAPR